MSDQSLWYKTCLKKNTYSSKKYAKQVAKSSKRRSGVTIRVYKCPYCEMFHLTSKKESNDGTR